MWLVLYSASTDRPQPPPNAGNIVRFGVIGFIALLIVLVVGKPAVALYMNIGEFDDQFTRPLFYSLVSAVILGIIALVRVNIVSRSSIFWYAISTLITFASSAQNQNIQNIQAYRKYKLGRISFVVWQITKILLFGAFFTNILFGFAAMEFIWRRLSWHRKHCPTVSLKRWVCFLCQDNLRHIPWRQIQIVCLYAPNKSIFVICHTRDSA